MPRDRMVDEEEEYKGEGDDSERSLGAKRRYKDFDCPDCNANNPWDESFGNGDEIRCFYCGQEFRAVVNEEGRLRLKAS
jgi:DNA-directed RNA polymerase subunit RPC12/RpoP